MLQSSAYYFVCSKDQIYNLNYLQGPLTRKMFYVNLTEQVCVYLVMFKDTYPIYSAVSLPFACCSTHCGPSLHYFAPRLNTSPTHTSLSPTPGHLRSLNLVPIPLINSLHTCDSVAAQWPRCGLTLPETCGTILTLRAVCVEFACFVTAWVIERAVVGGW